MFVQLFLLLIVNIKTYIKCVNVYHSVLSKHLTNIIIQIRSISHTVSASDKYWTYIWSFYYGKDFTVHVYL